MHNTTITIQMLKCDTKTENKHNSGKDTDCDVF